MELFDFLIHQSVDLDLRVIDLKKLLNSKDKITHIDKIFQEAFKK